MGNGMGIYTLEIPLSHATVYNIVDMIYRTSLVHQPFFTNNVLVLPYIYITCKFSQSKISKC